MKKIIEYFAISLIALGIIFPALAQAEPEYSYKWISQSGYLDLYPEETARLWVMIENTGTATWDKDIPIHLGTSHPLDRHSGFYADYDWLADNRSAWLTDETVIEPGERAVFMFDIVAPKQPGTYKEYFQPVVEGISWLEDYGIFWQLTVKSTEDEPNVVHESTNNYGVDGIYRSTLVNQPDSSFTIAQGESKNLSIEIKNTGTATWHNDGSYPVRLGTGDPWDRNSIFQANNWLADNRVANLNESSVDPSYTGSYSFTLEVPDNAVPGVYYESFESVAEGKTWFMDHNITYKITVYNPNPGYGQLLTNDEVDQFNGSGSIITITDLESGRQMQVKALGMDHWHSDVVPVTKDDTQLIRDMWNFQGEFTPYCPGSDWILWKPAAVTVQIDTDPEGRTIAASIIGCPHDVDGGITDNDFPGHLCLHFLDSMQHGKSEPDCSFQKMVQKAAGNPNYSTYGQSTPCWNPCITGDC